MVVDEQLAGHVEGVGILRGAVGGMKKGYSRFQNTPHHIVIDGSDACVVSHISAANASGVPIEATGLLFGSPLLLVPPCVPQLLLSSKYHMWASQSTVGC